MAVNQDFSRPLLVDKPRDYQTETVEPIKHSWWAWIGFALALLAVVATFCYSLSYTVMNTYTQPVPPPLVTTRNGNVSGYWDPASPNLAVFRGIPYAKPPIGQKRWKLPEYPADSWTGNRQAVKNGNICWQFGACPLDAFPNQDEDCLNINVWTNNLNNATGLWDPTTVPLPTLVWIYGGSNVYGSISMYTDLDNWARHYPLCLVSMNYRLNAFGYLALKELSQNDTRGVSGNYGIADIQAALRWVQDNIAAFGCDPKKVTLFGQSSGGTNIFALLASSKSKGLFHRAISLSGSANITMDLATAENQNLDFLRNTQCDKDPDVLSCLYNKDAADILSAIPNDTKTGWAFSDFWPTDPNGLVRPGLIIVDSDIVTMPFTDALAQGLNDVDVIIENNRDELELFWQALDVTSLNATAYNEYLYQNFLPWPYRSEDGKTAGEVIAAKYQNVTDQSVVRSYYDFNSDFGIYCANVELGKIAASKFKSNVYISVAWQPPSKNITVDPNLPSIGDAMHLWDFMAATGAWNFFQTNGGSIFFPNASQDPVPAFNPDPFDTAWGQSLSTQFWEFIQSGTVTSGMLPFNNVTDFPNNYNVAVQGDDARSAQVFNTINFRSDYCDLLKEIGLEPSPDGPIQDGRFWWIN